MNLAPGDGGSFMTPLLQARALTRSFPGVKALDTVHAEFRTGEVTAVMGENGAGKSTLMKAIAGIHPPDSGEILWQGKPVRITSVAQAEALGIAFIHQELNLCENLTVSENIFLGREPRRAGIFVDRSRMREKSVRLLDRVGLKLGPDTPVESLSIGRRQMVEIARALSQDARLVIMDEPTSSLTATESARLFDLVRELKAKGIAVVFISHRLPEVQALADRVIVLRDGRNSGTLTKEEISPARIVSCMVGRDLDPTQRRPETIETGPVRLEVRNLRTRQWPQHAVSFSIRAGEICSLAGLVGAGRTELARAIAGIDPPVSGSVLLDGLPLPSGDVRAAVRAGLVLAPEDRKEQGLTLDFSIRENIAIPSLNRLHRAGFVRESAVTSLAEEQRKRLSIRSRSIHMPAGQLSGGNQQKVVLAKWLARNPGVVVLDEPTRGVDVGSKHEIYTIIEALAAQGTAVLVISSDLEEVLRISDRVIVLHEGRPAGEVPRNALSEEAIMQLATGTAGNAAA